MGKTKEEKEREKLEKQREKEKKKELKKLPKEERKLLEAEAVLEDPATPASKVIELLKKHWDQFNGEHSVRAVVKAMETHAQSPDVQYMGCNVLAILMGSGGSCEAGVQAVISQGGAAAAVRAFKTHKRERNVVRWAAAVLERTTAVGTEVAGRILSGGLTDGFGQSLVSALQLYGEDAEILGNCMRVLLHVSQVNSPATAKALADYQGLDVLVAVLAARPGAPDIALPACKVLADLTHTRTNTYGKRFCELGGVGAVVQAMKAAAGSGEQGRDVQFVATKVLSNVTNGNPWAQALMGSGEGFECVVGAMEAFPGDAEMQLWGASVFAHVDAAASPDAAQALYAAGGVDVLVAALRAHAAASLVQETACRALGNLALNSEERAAGVAGSGGMEAALASITGHKREASVVQAGCYALTSIAYACPTPECLGVVAPHTEMFVNMLKYYKDEQYIQEYGWNLLATLALNDPTATATAAGAAAAFGRAGGVEAVLAQINAHNGDVCLVENGVQLLATTLVTDENKVRAVASDGIRTVVLAMLKYPESEMVHFWGCIALGNIAACTARLVQEAVSRSTLALAVLRSMRTHRADPEVLSNASLALANAACTNAEARTAIVRSFGVETLLALMRQHAGDDSPALLANCCSALAALARGSEEVQARVSAYGGIADIVAALRAFRADDYAANMCVAALAAFTTNLYKLVECGGLDALIRTMLRHSTAAGAISISIAASSGTYALGIQILARLTYSSAASSNTMAFARSAGAGVITTETAAPQSVLCQRIAMAVAQMDGKKLDAGTQATGCTALAACCPIPPAEQATAVACGCVEAPVLAALIHIDNLAVQVRAWAALAAMASGEPACARAGQLLCVELAACVLHRCMGQQKQGQG